LETFKAYTVSDLTEFNRAFDVIGALGVLGALGELGTLISSSSLSKAFVASYFFFSFSINYSFIFCFIFSLYSSIIYYFKSDFETSD